MLSCYGLTCYWHILMRMAAAGSEVDESLISFKHSAISATLYIMVTTTAWKFWCLCPLWHGCITF